MSVVPRPVRLEPFSAASPVTDGKHDCHVSALRATYTDAVGKFRDFLLILGSKSPGRDDRAVEREEPSFHMEQSKVGTEDDGMVTWIDSGYAIASGTGPIVRGRRSRAGSPGTQFVVEQLKNGPERIYLLTIAGSHVLTVHAIPEGGAVAVAELKDPDTWIEVDANGKFTAGVKAVADSSEAQKAFVANMKRVLGLTVPVPAIEEARGNSNELAKQRSPLGEFAKQFPNSTIRYVPLKAD